MATNASSPRAGALAIWIGLAVWAVALLCAGALRFSAPWGPALLASGAAVAVVLAAGLVTRAALAALYAALIVSAGGLIAVGAALSSAEIIVGGALGVLGAGATAPVAFLLREQARAGRSAMWGSADVVELLHRIGDNTMLSEGARRVLFRERELDLLRRAIEEDIATAHYDAALALCDEMAELFGCREEAETFRGNILRARQERYETEAAAAVAELDGLLARGAWAEAHGAAARIHRLYGDSHLAQNLDDRILRARDEHKRDLERQFLEAAQREDVENAMDILRRLDRYLDRDEAGRLTEVAQGVVVRHRENLGVQFKLAVNDHRWAEAARIGEEIVGEFPNTKMAGEVRSMIDLLRTRAAQTAMASSESAS
jgi:tetratricopeptide (TPR) repeat protein